MLSQLRAASLNNHQMSRNLNLYIVLKITRSKGCVCYCLRKLTDLDETAYLRYGDIKSLKIPTNEKDNNMESAIICDV